QEHRAPARRTAARTAAPWQPLAANVLKPKCPECTETTGLVARDSAFPRGTRPLDLKLTSPISMGTHPENIGGAMPTAVITGASQGLGRAVARALAERGWSLVVDARHAGELAAAVRGLSAVTAIPGDVTDPAHRARIATAIAPAGRLDLLVNN